MSAPRAAAMVSTSQSMGSQLRPGVNIWWNSSVMPYRLDSAAATMGAHFDSSLMGLATSSAPAGPCGFKWKRSALHSAAPSTRYSLKCPTGLTSTLCPNRAAACADSHCLTAEKMPVLLSMSIPLRLDMKKMSASMAMTAIQEIMHAVLRWILTVTCGFSGVEALFAVVWEAFSLVIMHPSLAKTSPRAGGVRGRSRKVRGSRRGFRRFCQTAVS